MPADTADYIAKTRRLKGGDAFLWLFSVSLRTDTTVFLRLARNTSNVTWLGHVWYARAVGAPTMGESMDGHSRPMKVTFSDADRQLAALAEAERLFIGSPCRVYQVDESQLGLATARRSWKTRIADCQQRFAGLEFSFGELRDMDKEEPHERYDADG